jgi:ABC-type nitrate/sulfonate/bicarbonate transport system substrate-binding protein
VRGARHGFKRCGPDLRQDWNHQPTFGHAPFYVARDKGFFKNEGFVGEVIVMNRDDLILQSLVSDSIQFGNICARSALPGPGTGSDQSEDDRWVLQRHDLFHHRSTQIPNAGTAQGRATRGLRLQAGSTQVLKYILKQKGLIYPWDYNLLRAGGTTLRYAALQTQQVDAAVLAEPVSLIAQEKGLVNLGDAYKLVPGYQLAGVWIKEEWAKKNRDLTLRFTRAFYNALTWLHDNRSEALELLPRITTLQKQYVQTSWETYTKAQIWPRDGKVNIKGLQLVIDLMAEEGQLKKPYPKPEEVIDHTYLQEVTGR